MIYTSGSQFQSLFVNTPDSDHQLVRSALRAWTVFRLTCSLYTVSIAPYSMSRVIRCGLHHFRTFIHSLHCASSSSTDECDIIYLWYIQFKFTSRTHIFTLNGISLLRTGIMVEWMSTSQGTYVRLEQRSAIFNIKRAILAPFLPNKIHLEPQNIRCPNKDNTAYS